MRHLTASTFEKLVIDWQGNIEKTMAPPDALLMGTWQWQRQKGFYLCWERDSQQPLNVWWESLRLRGAPRIHGPVVLMRLWDAFTISDLRKTGVRVLGERALTFSRRPQ